MLGAADITAATVASALLNFEESEFEHLIIRTVRLPQVLAGLLVGMALAVAGAIMQALTRNPLADSGILGINAGAAFAVVVTLILLRLSSLAVYAIAGMLGAAAAGALVYALGSSRRGGLTPLRLTLTGVIVTAFFSALTTLILIADRETLDQIRFWTAGSLAGRDMPLLRSMTLFLVGMALSTSGAILHGIRPTPWRSQASSA